jgi:NACalpha-BTF3-like transcription factor
VRRLRLRLTAVAPRLGLDSSEFDATNWSSISFRKGGLSARAPHVQPHELAQHADHASVETTRKSRPKVRWRLGAAAVAEATVEERPDESEDSDESESESESDEGESSEEERKKRDAELIAEGMKKGSTTCRRR